MAIPPGQGLSWRARYGPPPARNALIFARIMLGIQAALWSLSLLLAPLVFFDKPLPPGVTSQYGDLQSPSISRNIITLLVSAVIVASTVTTTCRLAPSRPRLWWLALATQTSLTVLYGWFFTRMAVAPSPEGLASFTALLVGPVAVAIPVIGLVALAIAVRARSSPWPAEPLLAAIAGTPRQARSVPHIQPATRPLTPHSLP